MSGSIPSSSGDWASSEVAIQPDPDLVALPVVSSENQRKPCTPGVRF
jgi:hypothetical protein